MPRVDARTINDIIDLARSIPPRLEEAAAAALRCRRAEVCGRQHARGCRSRSRSPLILLLGSDRLLLLSDHLLPESRLLLQASARCGSAYLRCV